MTPRPLQRGDAEEKELLLTAGDIVRWATLSGDPNPLHHDEAVARASRFGTLIASGGHLVALLTSFCAAFTTARGPGLGLEFSYQLRKAARAGETLRLRWEVTAVERSEKLGGDLVFLDGEIRDGRGTLLVAGKGKILSKATL
ncbi:MAG TPA: MaoC family dehydratase [Anaeromyxobacteraceae bacterium]